MGRYITWKNVVDRYSKLAEAYDSGETESAFIVPAEAEVDARLAPVYAVPFVPGSSAPELIRDLSIDLAYYKATWQNESSKVLKESLTERFTALLKGTMTLTTSAGIVEPMTGTVLSDRGYGSAFGPDNPIDFQMPTDWVDAARDERD